MVEIVNLAQLREQVRLETDDSSQDGLLDTILAAAVRAIENRTSVKLQGEGANIAEADVPAARQAVLMLAAHWFKNREVAGEMPVPVEWLIQPLAKLSV